MPQEEFTNVLPSDFDGVFRFTNWTDKDFIGRWDSKDYFYPANKTTPMVIMSATPLEIQNIRKKFARELAEREFFKTQKGISLASQERNADGTPKFNSIHMAGQYSADDMKDLIQKALTPLPSAAPTFNESPRENVEEKLSRTPKGKLRTRVLGDGESLVEQAKSGDIE